MRFANTVETRAPAGRIWALWTDVERWPAWDTELAAASLDGEFAPGAAGSLKPRRGPSSRFVISALEPREGYTFTTRLPLCELNVKRFLASEDGRTRFTHEVWFAGPLAFLFNRLLGPGYKRALPEVMENLRKIAERSGA